MSADLQHSQIIQSQLNAMNRGSCGGKTHFAWFLPELNMMNSFALGGAASPFALQGKTLVSGKQGGRGIFAQLKECFVPFDGEAQIAWFTEAATAGLDGNPSHGLTHASINTSDSPSLS